MKRALERGAWVLILLLGTGCATVGERMVAAARSGRVGDLGRLLDRGASPDAWGVDHQTPLMAAAEAGRTDAVRLLLDRGADPNATDWEGDTALIQAARNGHAKVLGMLLAHGARVDARREGESSPGSGYSVFAEPAAPARILSFEEAGPRRARSPADGETALLAAARAGHPEAVRVLLDAGADPSARNRWGESALELARDAGHEEVARLLRQRGAGK